MDDPGSPRRRRSSQQPAKGSSFPLAPILIGVVVLGFVIGAGLSLGGKHPQDSGTPAPVVSLAAAQTATPEPAATPSPAPTQTHAKLQPVASASPAVTVRPGSPQPSAAPSPTPQAVVLRTMVPHTAAPATAPPRTAAPQSAAPQRTHAPTLPPTAPPAATPQPTDDADSAFGRLSAAVVRQYLRSLMRGDTESAYGAFGVAPGSKGVDLTEQSIVDPTTSIESVQARGSNDAQSVNVTLRTQSGAYAAQYTLHRTSTGAAVIVSHTFSKL